MQLLDQHSKWSLADFVAAESYIHNIYLLQPRAQNILLSMIAFCVLGVLFEHTKLQSLSEHTWWVPLWFFWGGV